MTPTIIFFSLRSSARRDRGGAPQGAKAKATGGRRPAIEGPSIPYDRRQMK